VEDSLAELLKPIIGFMQYHLQKGLEPAEVFIMAVQKHEFQGVENRHMGAALKRAILNARALEACRLCQPKQYKQPDGSWSSKETDNYPER
jgi:hypothetical protein